MEPIFLKLTFGSCQVTLRMDLDITGEQAFNEKISVFLKARGYWWLNDALIAALRKLQNLPVWKVSAY